MSDYAGVLNPTAASELNLFLDQLKQKTGVEVAVVTIKNLEGDSVERFTNELFTTWGIGVKSKDNGALILVALEDRKMRIEVGYGLEGILPDGLCGQIIREQMAPYFRQGDFSRGILQGTSAVAEVIAKNSGITLTRPESIPPAEQPRTLSNADILIAALFAILFLIMFIRHPFLTYFLLSGGGGGWRGGGFGGGGSDFGGGFGGGMSGGGGASGSW